MATKKTPPVPPIPAPPAAADATPEVPAEAAVEAPATAEAPVVEAPAETPVAATPAVPEPYRPNPYAAATTPAPDASPYTAPPAPVVPQYQAAPQAGAYQAAPYVQGPPSGLSITSMVIGLVALFFSLFGSGLLPGIAAVITGHLGQKRQPHAKGFWLTGLISGYVSIGIGLIVVAFWVVIFAVGASSGWS